MKVGDVVKWTNEGACLECIGLVVEVDEYIDGDCIDTFDLIVLVDAGYERWESDPTDEMPDNMWWRGKHGLPPGPARTHLGVVEVVSVNRVQNVSQCGMIPL